MEAHSSQAWRKMEFGQMEKTGEKFSYWEQRINSIFGYQVHLGKVQKASSFCEENKSINRASSQD